MLKLGRGVCQDFAHVFIAVARTVGIPCRYVSGYVAPTPEEAFVGTSHAWAEAWVPGRGWLAYDPTHPRVPNLTAGDVKKIILGSVTRLNDQSVLRPGGGQSGGVHVRFGDLSATGGIVNAYNAIRMAEDMSNGKARP